VLKVSHLNVHYGPIPALLDVSMVVQDGDVTAVLGTNGAGKSSLLRALSGVIRKVEGLIEFGGTVVLKKGMGSSGRGHFLRADEILRLGIAHVPEGRQMFPDLNVEENLRLGGFTCARSEIAPGLERVYEYFPRLKEKRKLRSASLSGGEQQMVAIGRALMGKPRLLMLDEPSTGLAPRIISDLFDVLVRINKEERCTVLVVEQNANIALQIAAYGYVLEAPGHITVEGPAEKLKNDEAVKKAYLGARSSG
jgi:branched-chain amino acid transport system ATP-binding protein